MMTFRMRAVLIYLAVISLYLFGNTSCFTQSKATLSIARYFAASTSVGDYALFGGGIYSIGGAHSNVVDIYNASNNTWSVYNFEQTRNFVAATSVGRYALFGGGQLSVSNTSSALDNVDIFDSVTGTWTKAKLSQARFSLAATSVGKFALFGGGWITTTYSSNAVDIFNSETLEWTTATLSTARAILSATTAARYALFAGGQDDTTAQVNNVDIFDSITGNWTTSALGNNLQYISATSVGNFAIFGAGSRPGGAYFTAAYIYNAVDQTWSTTALSNARSFAAGTSVGNVALIGGGYNGAYQNRVDILQLTPMNSWALSQTNLNQSRYDLTATSVGSKAMFAGGYSGAPASNVVDIFDFSDQFDAGTKSSYDIVPILECIDQNAVAHFGYRNNEGKTVVITDLSRNYITPQYVFPEITFTAGRSSYYPLNPTKFSLTAQGTYSWHLDNFTLTFNYNNTDSTYACPTAVNIIIAISISGDYQYNATLIAQSMRQLFVTITAVSDARVTIVSINISKKKSALDTTSLEVELSVAPPDNTGEPSAAQVVQQFASEQTNTFTNSLPNQPDIKAQNVSITIKEVSVNPTDYVEGSVPPPVQSPVANEPSSEVPMTTPLEDSPPSTVPYSIVPIAAVSSAVRQLVSFILIGCLLLV